MKDSKKPKAKFSNNRIKFIKKIGDGIYNFIDNYNNDTLYLFDYEDVKKQYLAVMEQYKNYPGLMDIEDFSKNYSFAYYQKQGLLDYQEDAEKMTIDVLSYLCNLKKSGNI
jgi:hypothetical protein